MPGLMENRSQGPLVEAGSEQRGFYLPSLLRLSEPLHESPTVPRGELQWQQRAPLSGRGSRIVCGLGVVNMEARACVWGVLGTRNVKKKFSGVGQPGAASSPCRQLQRQAVAVSLFWPLLC